MLPKTLRTAALIAFLVVAPCPVWAQPGRTNTPRYQGVVERLDPRLGAIIPVDAQMEVIAEGYDWAEGPVWDVQAQSLLFSDVPRNTVHRTIGRFGATVDLRPSGYTSGPDRGGETGSNGLTYNPEGDLVLMQHGNRQVAKLGKDKQFLTLADRFEGKRLNSPNDGVFSKRGDLYFTDPPYGLPKGMSDPAKELDFQGVYRLTKEGKLTLITKEMSFPNGIALSPDEKTLYVANSDSKRAIWMTFPLSDDGAATGPGKVFFDATSWVGSRPGLPDGMKVDGRGNLFASGPGGILIFGADAIHLGTLTTGVPTANCGWGGDGKTLYITANHAVLRIRTSTGVTLPAAPKKAPGDPR